MSRAATEETDTDREISRCRRADGRTHDNNERGNFAGGNGCGRLAVAVAVATFFLPSIRDSRLRRVARSHACSLLIALSYDDSTVQL